MSESSMMLDGSAACEFTVLELLGGGWCFSVDFESSVDELIADSRSRRSVGSTVVSFKNGNERQC